MKKSTPPIKKVPGHQITRRKFLNMTGLAVAGATIFPWENLNSKYYIITC